jgi:hypothetical protein
VTYIDKAIGKQLAPFAKAFKGEIILDVARKDYSRTFHEVHQGGV